MSAPNETCSNCRFHHAFALPGTNRTVHQCRKAAPTIHPVDGASVFPLVQPAYWCGDWSQSQQAKASKPKAVEAPHRDTCCCLQCLQAHPERWRLLGPGQQETIRNTYPDLAERLEKGQ